MAHPSRILLQWRHFRRLRGGGPRVSPPETATGLRPSSAGSKSPFRIADRQIFTQRARYSGVTRRPFQGRLDALARADLCTYIMCKSDYLSRDPRWVRKVNGTTAPPAANATQWMNWDVRGTFRREIANNGTSKYFTSRRTLSRPAIITNLKETPLRALSGATR